MADRAEIDTRHIRGQLSDIYQTGFKNLSQEAQHEYLWGSYHALVNIIVEESDKIGNLALSEPEDKALFRTAIALNLATQRNPEKERTAGETELIVYLQKSTDKYSDSCNFRLITEYAGQLVGEIVSPRD